MALEMSEIVHSSKLSQQHQISMGHQRSLDMLFQEIVWVTMLSATI